MSKIYQYLSINTWFHICVHKKVFSSLPYKSKRPNNIRVPGMKCEDKCQCEGTYFVGYVIVAHK